MSDILNQEQQDTTAVENVDYDTATDDVKNVTANDAVEDITATETQETQSTVEQEPVVEPATDSENKVSENAEQKDNNWKEFTDDMVNPVSKETIYQIKLDKDADMIVFPNGSIEKFQKVLDKLDSIPEDALAQVYTDEDYAALGMNMSASSYSIDRDVYQKELNNPNNIFVNKLSYGDKDLSIRPIGMNTKAKALSGDSAIAKFSSMLGVGEIVQIPLYHSGFWITLKPILDTELFNLEMQIANNQIELGRITNGLIYSNYSVVYTRIITDFIVSKIQSQTIALEEEDDIRDYIKVQDIYVIAAGLLYSMYPNGYTLSRPCSNSLVLDEDNKLKCNHILKAKVDFRWLVNVNYSALSKDHKQHMSSRSPNSVTKEAVAEYVKTLSINKPKQYTYETGTGTTTLEIVTPTLGEYINNGEKWVMEIISSCRSLFTDTTSPEEKNRIINETSNTVILNIYNIYVTKIIFDDGSYVSNKADINQALGILSGDETNFAKVINDIISYIETNVVAITGIPDYTCPTCKMESQNGETVTNKDFKDIVPINLLQTFFVLSAQKAQKARTRSIS